MREEIDLSIIVPIYNVEQYLKECLESIYALNLRKEVILINDGSTDNSLAIAKEYQEKFLMETILISKENEGLSEARNEGLRIAKGRYIYFIDSDDYLEPLVFEKIFTEALEENVEILHGNGVRYYSEEKKEKLHDIGMEIGQKCLTGKEFLYKMYEKESYHEVVWLNIYKRQYLLKNQFFFQKGIVYEDTLFSLPVFWKSEKVKYVPDCFYYYRMRENSIMSGKRQVPDFLFVFSRNIDFILKNNVCHPEITRKMISQFRSFMKNEGVFDKTIYKNLWKLPFKNRKAWGQLLQCVLRKYRILLVGEVKGE